MSELQAAFDAGFEAVKKYVDGKAERLELELKALARRSQELELALAALPAGDTGPPGDRGPAGRGIADVVLNRSGELVLTLDDGTLRTVGPIVGADGRDGIDGAPGRDGIDGAPGRDGIDGAPGRDGIDGAPGRDGIDGAAGRDGFELSDFTVEYDGERSVAFCFGETVRHELSIPALIDRGVWKPGNYTRGDVVSQGGSLWIAQQPTGDKPGASQAWRLAVKRGRDGKS